MSDRNFMVILAFIVNRVGFYSTFKCRCSGLTPLFATIPYGLAVVALLLRYVDPICIVPCWIRRYCTIRLVIYFISSFLIIETAYCVWNAWELLVFYKLPKLLLEAEMTWFCEIYSGIIDSPATIGFISNLTSILFLVITLQLTEICNFSGTFKKKRRHELGPCEMFIPKLPNPRACQNMNPEVPLIHRSHDNRFMPDDLDLAETSNCSRKMYCTKFSPKKLRSGRKY